MKSSSEEIEGILRRNIDERAAVAPSDEGGNLSPFLSGAFDFHKVIALEREIFIAEPINYDGDVASMLKRCAALEKAMGKDVVLFLDLPSPSQRRRLVRSGQGFISKGGDLFLPMLSIVFGARAIRINESRSKFTPSQQAVFLFCLYTETEVIKQADVKKALGFSAGSISSAFSLFVELRMMDYAVGGKTGRQRDYLIEDKADFYRIGIERFGDPVRERMLVPLILKEPGWLLGGLSALALRSDLVVPKRPVFAVSPSDAKELLGKDFDAEDYGWLQVLRYDPAPFADGGCVDALTMALSLDDDDERVSLALRTAMEGYEWYRG